MSDNEFTEEIQVPYEHELKFPVTIGTEPNTKTFKSLTIQRRPKALDFKGFGATNMKADDAMKLLSRICEVPLTVVENLDAWDFIKLQEVITDFLPDNG
jgi:hypothetical protein